MKHPIAQLTKIVCLLLICLYAGLMAGRQALACRIEIPHRPVATQPLQTREHNVSITMRNQTAEVTVQATFYNPNDANVEGDYWFPLYADAAVTSFSMIVNGREMQAELLDADQARQTYEEIVRQQRDPGLLEFVGTRMLRQRIFPIQPRSEVKVFLKYAQLLTSQSGTVGFKYPLSSAKPDGTRIGKVSISAYLESPTPIANIYSSSHDIKIDKKDSRTARISFEASDCLPDKTFTLYYTTTKDDIGVSLVSHKPQNDDGYFTLLVSPGIDYAQAKVIAKDFIFVIDTSGSMSGSKLRGARDALKICISRLNSTDRFNIIRFSSGVDRFRDGLCAATKENMTAGASFVERMTAEGGTAINEALKSALQQFSSSQGRLPAIVFLTDGQPTVGEQNIQRILENMQAANSARVRIFAFGVGTDVNTELLDKVAEQSMGEKEYIGTNGDSVEAGISSLCGKIENPVLTGLELVFDTSMKVYDVYPKVLPDLFKGGQLIVTGRYQGSGEKRVRLTGLLGDARKEFQYVVSFTDQGLDDCVPRFWALKKMSFLLGEINLRGKNDELVDEIRKLGKKFGIVTPYTSFLIVEEGLRQMTLGGRTEQEAQMKFETAKTGADAVNRSKMLAEGARKQVVDSMQYAAPAMPASEPERKSMLAKLEKNIVQAGDKTFILQSDGYYTDSSLTEKEIKEGLEIKFMSPDYLDLLKSNPEVSKYLSVSQKLIFKHKGIVYKVVPEK
jgi:Ca-activated chloride channel family protein